MIPDTDFVSDLIREVAEEEIMPRFRRLGADDVRQKTGPQDLVTAADLASEERLSRALVAHLPGSLAVGEEAVAAAPELLARLSGADPVWVIDPLDGTLNFTEGRTDFTVIVALVRDGETVAGWIHHPIGGETINAVRGGGAWLDGRRVTVAPALDPEALTGALYIGPRRAPELFERVKELRPRLGPRAYTRCAGAEHMALARGDVHYAIFTRIMPWDHAAGCLIHGEAGGYLALMSGEPYRPAKTEGQLMMAPDEATWQRLRTLFTARADGEGASRG